MSELDKIAKILDDSKSINTSYVAEEVLKWAANHVEDFIDNKSKLFKINIHIDSGNELIETKKLQDLYSDVPDDEKVISLKNIEALSKDNASFNIEDAGLDIVNNCRRTLDLLVDEAFRKMQQEKDLLRKLFERMIFYYEMKGIKNGKPIIQELDGAVDILKFEYEPFTVKVQIKDTQREGTTEAPVITKEYEIPEGLCLWIEMSYKAKTRPTSLF